MASKGRRDVVARLVSKKLRSRILKSCSSSEEDSLENDSKVEEEHVESLESIQEEAGRCKHGPPTDYPCHLCCHQKWVSARRLEQPLLDRGRGKEQESVLCIGGSEQVSRDIQAKSKEKKREHSEEKRGDCADILFDGITVGPKTKQTKLYGFNLPPGVTITHHQKFTHKEAPKQTKEKDPGVTIASGDPLNSNDSSTANEVPIKLIPSLSEDQKQLREIVKKTDWAEVFRMSGMSVLGKPVPGGDEVIIEDATKCDKTVEEWECTFCTFLNSGEDRIRCQMCQGERSEGGKSADQPGGMQKQCPFCTLLNMPHREKCAACEGVLD